MSKNSNIIEQILNEKIAKHGDSMLEFINNRHSGVILYSSMDIRNSGNKIAPIDANLFPSGFNNLTETCLENSVKLIGDYLDNHDAGKKILIIPENHTRNLGYLDNITTLKKIVELSGREAVFGNTDLNPESHEKRSLSDSGGNEIVQFALSEKSGKLVVGEDFIPDSIIINNDFSAGMPSVIDNISQSCFPPPFMGWYCRSKADYFRIYRQICDEFAAEFDFDPWLIYALYDDIDNLNFKTGQNLDILAKKIDQLIGEINQKYQEYNIKTEPYLFIKAAAGTYGMGIITAKNGEEVLHLNKKYRNKMNIVKEGRANHHVIIQEAIPTIERFNGNICESLVYFINSQPAGYVWRVNKKRDEFSNLNSMGAEFIGDDDLSYSGLTPSWLIGFLAELAAMTEVAEAKKKNKS